MTVGELARIVRSKNAGIGVITIDVVCDDRTTYDAISAVLTRERVAAAYGVAPGAIAEIIQFEAGNALKINFARTEIAGGAGLGETDLYGSAQYAPLLSVEV
jgi:hypothetical protein